MLPALSGFSSTQEWLCYQKKALPYKPDIVLLLANIPTDLLDNMNWGKGGGNRVVLDVDEKGNFFHPRSNKLSDYKPVAYADAHTGPDASQKAYKRFLTEHSALYRYSRTAMHDNPRLHKWLIRHKLAEPKPAGYFEDMEKWLQVFNPQWPPDIEHSWKISQAVFLHFAQDTHKRGIPFVVMSVPFVEQVNTNRLTNIYPELDPLILENRIQQFLLDHHIESIRLLDKLRSIPNADKRFYLAKDHHFNEEGYVLLADLLEPVMISKIKALHKN